MSTLPPGCCRCQPGNPCTRLPTPCQSTFQRHTRSRPRRPPSAHTSLWVSMGTVKTCERSATVASHAKA